MRFSSNLKPIISKYLRRSVYFCDLERWKVKVTACVKLGAFFQESSIFVVERRNKNHKMQIDLLFKQMSTDLSYDIYFLSYRPAKFFKIVPIKRVYESMPITSDISAFGSQMTVKPDRFRSRPVVWSVSWLDLTSFKWSRSLYYIYFDSYSELFEDYKWKKNIYTSVWH